MTIQICMLPPEIPYLKIGTYLLLSAALSVKLQIKIIKMFLAKGPSN